MFYQHFRDCKRRVKYTACQGKCEKVEGNLFFCLMKAMGAQMNLRHLVLEDKYETE